MRRCTSGDGAATPAAAAVAAASQGQVQGRESFKKEMETLSKLCLPMFFTFLFEALHPITSFAYAGWLTDAASLAGLGLGISVCNITGVCIFYGMGSGIDVLCTQAFGAKNQRLVGVTFVRGTFLTSFLFVPIAFLWYNMERVLLSIGQQPNIAHITGTFARAYLWGMIPFAVFENLKRCLQAQNHVMPVMIVALLGFLANVVFHHLTMVVLGMGVYGAGLALSLTGMFLLTTLIAYTWIFKLGEGCWSGIYSMEVFRDWKNYLAESIPGLVGLFIEWTSVEASTFLAGLLGAKQLAIQVMILSAYGIVFQFSLSISIGATIRVGNHLGANNPDGARKAVWCGVRLAVAAAVMAGLGLGFGKGLWPKLYDVSEEVMDEIVDLTPIYVVAQMIDMVQNVCTGILKGMGQQRIQHDRLAPMRQGRPEALSGRGDDRDDDEEMGTRRFYKYGGGEIAMPREKSGGGRVKLDVGESSGLVAAAAGAPRRTSSGSSDRDNVGGLMEMVAAGEMSRLSPEAAVAASSARRDGTGSSGFDIIV
eukprot:g5728.t1